MGPYRVPPPELIINPSDKGLAAPLLNSVYSMLLMASKLSPLPLAVPITLRRFHGGSIGAGVQPKYVLDESVPRTTTRPVGDCRIFTLLRDPLFPRAFPLRPQPIKLPCCSTPNMQLPENTAPI